MSRKFRSIFLTLLVASATFTACIDSQTAVYETSNEVIIGRFLVSIETDSAVYVKYPFTIDQINNRIYNVDSFPVGTKIDKLVTYVTLVGSGSVAFSDLALTDTTYLTGTDSLDFSKQKYSLNVTAFDGYIKKYQLDVRVHTQDPDTLVWQKQSSVGTGFSEVQQVKALIFNNELLVFAKGATQMEVYTPTKELALFGFPAGIVADYQSVDTLMNRIVVLASDKNVYSSADGITWVVENQLANSGLTTLIGSLGDKLMGILTVEGERKFAVADKLQSWKIGETVPASFTPYPTMANYKDGRNKNIAVLFSPNGLLDKTLHTWTTRDGLSWEDLSLTTKYPMVNIGQTAIMAYENALFAFGVTKSATSSTANFTSWYKSKDGGITWKTTEPKWSFEPSFGGRKEYSTVVDAENYIWIVWGKTALYPAEVWKGRGNRFGFIVQ